MANEWEKGWATEAAQEITKKMCNDWSDDWRKNVVCEDGIAAIISRHADAELARLRKLCGEAARDIIHQPVKWCCPKFSRPFAGHLDDCIAKRLQDAAKGE